MSDYTYYEVPIARTGYYDPSVRKVVCLRSDDVVSFIQRELYQGVSRSGKAWSRWGDVAKITVSTRARGNGPRRVNVYQQTMGKQARTMGAFAGFRNVTPTAGQAVSNFASNAWMPHANDILFELSELINRAFPDSPYVSSREELLTAIYPMTEILREVNPQSVSNRDRMPSTLSLAARERTVEGYIKTAFGANRYRKDLVKASLNVDMGYTATLQPLATTVPIDWIIESLKGCTEPSVHRVNGYQISRKNGRTIAHMLRQMTPNHQRSRVIELPHVQLNVLLDTVRMYDIIATYPGDLITPETMKAPSWQQLHNRLMVIHRRLQVPYQEIEQTKTHKAIDGVTTSTGISICTAKNTHTLVQWSEEMNNCISSYGTPAARGQVILAGAYQDGKLLANLEITPQGEVRQLLGKHNRSIDSTSSQAIVTALQGTNVVTGLSARAWT